MDWQAGDEALCIKQDGSSQLPVTAVGQSYLVTDVVQCHNDPSDPETKGDGVGLILEDIWVGDHAYDPACFVKMPPSDMKLEKTSTPKEVEDAHL